ncbi:hypothetical protein [Wukongibacter baidiensis]
MVLKKIRYGDVFEIITERGLGFFQCVKEASASECETIRILPGVYEEHESVDLNNLTQQKEVFFVQFPLKYAVKKKCVKPVGNYTVPESVELPKYFRTKHIVRGEFISWHIVNSDTLQILSVKELSDEEKLLSPAGIWNDTLLAERIAEGWKPEDWK